MDEPAPEQNIPEETPPKSWEIDNLPNRLTFFRILLVPIVISTLMLIKANFGWVQPHLKFLGYLAAWTFVAASLTDILDGYIARRRKLVTVFGSFLDPIADKFLVVSSLIFLQALDRVHVLITVILVLREMYITSLRLLASTKDLTIQVGHFGRWKTICQMVAIPLLIAYDHPWGIPMPILGTVLIYLASILSLYSALEYSLGLLKKMSLKKSKDMGENA